MKKIKTLIAAAVLGLGVTVSSISPAAVSMQTAEAATVKQGLVKVKNKYYYYNAKGKKVKNKWVTVKVKGKKQKYYGSIIFFVGLTLPRYRFSKPSASLDMNLR